MQEPLPIEDGLPDPSTLWPPDVISACSQFECGDVIEDPPFFYFADTRTPIWAATFDYANSVSEDGPGPELVDAANYAPKYGVLTSQTCDIGEIDFSPMKRPWVMVAPVYDLQGLDKAVVSAIKKDRHSQFLVHLPALPTENGEVWAADLRIEIPLEKSMLAGRSPIKPFATSLEQQLQIGDRVAKLRSRPAWAISLLEVCRTLREFLNETKKANKLLWERVRDEIQEVGARVDDMTAPTAAQFCAFTSGPASDEVKDWWEEFYARAVAAHSGHINLQMNISLDLDTCSVNTYRAFQPVPFRA